LPTNVYQGLRYFDGNRPVMGFLAALLLLTSMTIIIMRMRYNDEASSLRYIQNELDSSGTVVFKMNGRSLIQMAAR